MTQRESTGTPGLRRNTGGLNTQERQPLATVDRSISPSTPSRWDEVQLEAGVGVGRVTRVAEPQSQVGPEWEMGTVPASPTARVLPPWPARRRPCLADGPHRPLAVRVSFLLAQAQGRTSLWPRLALRPIHHSIGARRVAPPTVRTMRRRADPDSSPQQSAAVRGQRPSGGCTSVNPQDASLRPAQRGLKAIEPRDREPWRPGKAERSVSC